MIVRKRPRSAESPPDAVMQVCAPGLTRSRSVAPCRTRSHLSHPVTSVAPGSTRSHLSHPVTSVALGRTRSHLSHPVTLGSARSHSVASGHTLRTVTKMWHKVTRLWPKMGKTADFTDNRDTFHPISDTVVSRHARKSCKSRRGFTALFLVPGQGRA